MQDFPNQNRPVYSNNKLRKLNFIRNKNLIRSGKRNGYTSVKISNPMLGKNISGEWRQMYEQLAAHDAEYAKIIQSHIDEAIALGWKVLKRKWKLNFDYSRIETTIGHINDDFMNNLSTIQIKYFK